MDGFVLGLFLVAAFTFAATNANPGKWRWILRVACDAGIKLCDANEYFALRPSKFRVETEIKSMI
jgi:hypothetical protein